jgi:hypothetical protein
MIAVTRTRLRALLPAVVIATTAGVGLVPSSPAAAADRCTGGSDVTVVVDFGSLGGGTPVVCVEGGGGRTAMSLMDDAKFELDQVRTGTPGFVCAIDRKPDPDTSCQRTPPNTAFWGLWWSDGSSARWIWSTSGAGGLTIPAGGSVGWRWQNGGPRDEPRPSPTTGTPSSSPKPSPTRPPESQEPTPKPTKEPAATAPATPGSPSASPGTSAAGPSSSSSAEEAAEKATRAEKRADQRSERGERAGEKGDQRKAKAGRRATREPDSAAADGERVTADAVAQEETALRPTSATDDGGGALTWAAGGAVLLLAAAAGVLARRRRG